MRYMSLFDVIFSYADNKIYLEAVKVFEVIFQFNFTTLILTVLWFYNPPSLHLKHNMLCYELLPRRPHLEVLHVTERPAAPHQPHAAQHHPGHAHVVEAVRGGGAVALQNLQGLLLPAEGEVTEVEAGAGGR